MLAIMSGVLCLSGLITEAGAAVHTIFSMSALKPGFVIQKQSDQTTNADFLVTEEDIFPETETDFSSITNSVFEELQIIIPEAYHGITRFDKGYFSISSRTDVFIRYRSFRI